MISLKYKIHISISPSQLPHGAEAAYGVTAEYYLLVCDEYALMVNVLGSIGTSGICIVCIVVTSLIDPVVFVWQRTVVFFISTARCSSVPSCLRYISSIHPSNHL